MKDTNFEINFITELQKLIATGKYSKVKITIPRNFCGVEFEVTEESEDIIFKTVEHDGFNLDK